MKQFTDCSGPCEECRIHYIGTCLAGHGDDLFTPVDKDNPPLGYPAQYPEMKPLTVADFGVCVSIPEEMIGAYVSPSKEEAVAFWKAVNQHILDELTKADKQ